MFFTVILGHFIAACFACMGLLNCCYCIGSATPQMGADNFFAQLSVAAWPLAVAAALEILLQLLGQVELMRLKGETAAHTAAPAAGAEAPVNSAAMAGAAAPAPETAEKKKKEEKKPEPDGGLRFFPIREPAPKSAPAAEKKEEKKPEPAVETAVKPEDFDAISALAEKAGHPEPRPEHLNEPAEHKAAETPAEEKTDTPAQDKADAPAEKSEDTPEDADTPTDENEEAPAEEKENGLRFFKVS